MAFITNNATPGFFQGFTPVDGNRREGLSQFTDGNSNFSPTETFSFSGNSQNSDLDQLQSQQQQFKNFRFQANSANTANTDAKTDGAEGKKVTVNQGDSLSKILLKAGYSKEAAFSSKVHDEVAAKNGLADKNKLRLGQVLTIPNPTEAQTKNETKSDASSDTSNTSSEDSKTKSSDDKKPVGKKPVAKKPVVDAKKTSDVKKVAKKPGSVGYAINVAKQLYNKDHVDFNTWSGKVDAKDPGTVMVKGSTMKETYGEGPLVVTYKVVNGKATLISEVMTNKKK